MDSSEDIDRLHVCSGTHEKFGFGSVLAARHVGSYALAASPSQHLGIMHRPPVCARLVERTRHGPNGKYECERYASTRSEWWTDADLAFSFVSTALAGA
jgi:hypothetical protein